ncbi:MAG: hypothetical protein IJ475_03415 [Bacilli bacterium]|nr:hypothetical protein [Bacilli bacterium]
MEIILTPKQEERLSQDLNATYNLIKRNQDNTYEILQKLTGSSPFIQNSGYESLYTHATEDMATYYKAFNATKTHLCIGASGEQVVNAILFGAQEIDVYDSNRLCRHALHLRLAAIESLTLEEYFEYYKSFSRILFDKIAYYLPQDEIIYWATVYSIFGPHNLNAGLGIAELLFTYKKLDDDLIKKINPYLTPENYNKLKRLIHRVKINYIDSDLYNLPKHIKDKTYDVINLSNIYEYLNYSKDVNIKNAKTYHKFVMQELYTRLNQNGTILVSYLYAWSDKLNKDFLEMIKETEGKVVGTEAMTVFEYPFYLAGLTTQNLAYSQLLEVFKNDKLERLQTEHVQYGQSKDMSHDLALLLRK